MQQRKKKKRRLRLGSMILTIFMLLLLATGIYFVSIYLKLNYRDFPANNSDLGITAPTDPDILEIVDDANDATITNIALFGVDQREGETSFRSDAIIVLTVDKRTDSIKLSSLMRDCAVEIDGHGQDKLTKAYFYGGPELAVKTINQNFGLNIQEFATVNFQQMASIIDAVNGVELDIENESQRKDINNSIREQSEVAGLSPDYIKKTGTQTLNGTQAVAYARIRYSINADFERTSRQREVLMKVFQKALDMSPLQYPEFARKFLPTVETSLDLGDVFKFGGILLRDIRIEDVRFPCNEDLIGNGSITIRGESCVNYDLQATKQKLQQFIYNDVNPQTNADLISNGRPTSDSSDGKSAGQ